MVSEGYHMFCKCYFATMEVLRGPVLRFSSRLLLGQHAAYPGKSSLGARLDSDVIAEDHIIFWKFYFSRTWYRLDVAALGDAQAHLPAGDLVSGDFEETAGISRLLWILAVFAAL